MADLTPGIRRSDDGLWDTMGIEVGQHYEQGRCLARVVGIDRTAAVAEILPKTKPGDGRGPYRIAFYALLADWRRV